jgi:hypothetical protein
MVDIGSVLTKVIESFLVPIVLLLLFGYGFVHLPEEPTSSAAKKAAHSARWAGLILFVLFVLWRRGQGDVYLVEMPEYRLELGFLIVTALAAAAGFVFSRFVDWLKGTKAFPLGVLVLVALMSIAIYTYFFIWASRVVILFLALGFAMGTLLNRAFVSLRSETPDDQKAN